MHTLCSSTSAIPPISENRRRLMQYTHKDTCNNQTLPHPTTPLETLTHRTPPQHTLAGNSWTTSDLHVLSIVLGLLDTPVYLDSQFSASSFCSYYLLQEVSSKSSSRCCGLRVSSTPLEWQKTLPFPYDLSSLQNVLHTICTQCAAPTSCLGHPVYTQSTDGRLSWSKAL